MDLQGLEKYYSDTALTEYKSEDLLLSVKIKEYGYDDLIVLRDINFDEYDVVKENQITGQSIAILGRSGRGKSTLFRLLSGLEYSNNVTIDIHTHKGLTSVSEGDVGMIDQKYTLFSHKTVLKTLIFAASRNKTENVSKDEIIAKAKDWDLEDHLNKYPNELSGGQRQRTAILEKILIGNHYLIMDEPVSGLDIVAIDKVKHNMKSILKAHEKNTLIFSSHDINFAYEMADSIYVIGQENNLQGSTIIEHFDKRFNNSFSKYDVIKALKNS